MTAQKKWSIFVTEACVCSYIELLFSDSACWVDMDGMDGDWLKAEKNSHLFPRSVSLCSENIVIFMFHV